MSKVKGKRIVGQDIDPLIVIDEEFALPDATRNELLDIIYFCSMFRTLGGFHRAEENLRGMKLGGVG